MACFLYQRARRAFLALKLQLVRSGVLVFDRTILKPGTFPIILSPRLCLILNTWFIGIVLLDLNCLHTKLGLRGISSHDAAFSSEDHLFTLAAFSLILDSLRSSADYHPVLCFSLNHLQQLFTETHSSPQGLPKDPFPRVFASYRWAGTLYLCILIPLLHIYSFRRFRAHLLLIWTPSPPEWEIGREIPLYVPLQMCIYSDILDVNFTDTKEANWLLYGSFNVFFDPSHRRGQNHNICYCA